MRWTQRWPSVSADAAADAGNSAAVGDGGNNNYNTLHWLGAAVRSAGARLVALRRKPAGAMVRAMAVSQSAGAAADAGK